MSLPTDCNYEHISEEFVPGCKYVALRCVAATASTLTVVMLYFVSRNFGATVWGALLASGLLLFDMLSNIQGRLVLLDVQLSFWCTASLMLAQMWWRRLNEHFDAEDREAGALGAGGGGGSAGGILGDEDEDGLDDAGGAGVSASPFGGASPAAASSAQRTRRAGGASALAAGGGGGGLPVLGAMYALYARCVSALLPPAPGVAAAPARLLGALERNAWSVGLGFVCANAFSVKMTGAVTPFLVAVESFFGLWFLRRGAPFLDLLKVLVVGMLTYAGWFAVHFAILTRHGDGDEEFTSVQFQSTLLENKHYDPTAHWEGFWYTFYSLNHRMIVHNANILAPHPWMSSWWEWILNLRGVAYYGKDFPHTYTGAVYLIGNHAVHYMVIAALAAFAVCVALYLRVRPFAARMGMKGLGLGALGEAAAAGARSPALTQFFASGSFCVAAYCLNLLPYLGVARSTFIYHYMPALIYGELLTARVVEHLAGRHTPQAARVVLLIAGLVWLHYTPWIYGFPLTNDAHQRRRWMPRWD